MNEETATPELTRRQRRELRRQEWERQRDRSASIRGSQRAALWVGVAVVLVGTVWALGRFTGGPSDAVPVPGVNEVVATDWTKGSADAPATLVEYSDFQCPACASYYPVLKQLASELGSEVRLVYRHFPLRTIHPNAEKAARAAEAAGLQGKFWEMHDLLFDRQQAWSGSLAVSTTFADYAEELGLDRGRFESDLESDEVRDRVLAGEASGTRARISGTPTFFLNGVKVAPSPSYEQMVSLIRNQTPGASQ